MSYGRRPSGTCALDGPFASNLRVVDSPDDCDNRETALSWNVEGPQGPEGPRGPDGPRGSAGADGSDASIATTTRTADGALIDTTPRTFLAAVECEPDEFVTGGGFLQTSFDGTVAFNGPLEFDIQNPPPAPFEGWSVLVIDPGTLTEPTSLTV